jgi:hypothetical protein
MLLCQTAVSAGRGESTNSTFSPSSSSLSSHFSRMLVNVLSHSV